MEYLILWCLFSILFSSSAAVIAFHKGRSSIGWFILGLFVGPFALIVALLPSYEDQAQQAARLSGYADGYKKCPYCAEAIRQEAVKCRYCHSDVSSTAPDEEEQHGRMEAERRAIEDQQRLQRMEHSKEELARLNYPSNMRICNTCGDLFQISYFRWQNEDTCPKCCGISA